MRSSVKRLARWIFKIEGIINARVPVENLRVLNIMQITLRKFLLLSEVILLRYILKSLLAHSLNFQFLICPIENKS